MKRRILLPAAAVVLLAMVPAWPAWPQERVTLFVTSEKTDTVGVYRGPVPQLTLVRGIKVGREPHNLGASPDGRWVATSNRRSGEVSVIDTGANAHDVTLSPDGRVAWITNSGFTHLPDSRVDYIDTAARRPVGSITVDKYPFHSPKRGRDGNPVPPTALWFSDHGLRSVVAVSLADRKMVATVPVGVEPYYVAATSSGILFVANHTSNTVTIVDGPRRAVLGTLKVAPRPHGLAVVVEL